jgi:sulfatase modifying factor 1
VKANIPLMSAIVNNDYMPELLPIKGGHFKMGSNEYDNEKPIHEVDVPDFYMGKYPITVGQYMAFVEDTNSNAPEWMEEDSKYNIYTGSDDHYKNIASVLTLRNYPIVGVSWLNAVAYCEWLSNKSDYTFRLPSESEWEYAARGGKHSKGFQYAGSNKLKEVGWYNVNSHREPKPVGMKMPNELGIYDMSGNVWEWCADHWHDNYEDAPKDGSARLDEKENNLRVVRGGSWGSYYLNCRVSSRYGDIDLNRDNDVGFRLSRY